MAQLQLASVGCYFSHVAAGFHLAIMMHTHLFYISSDGIADAPNSRKGVISVKTLTIQLIDAKPGRIRICRTHSSYGTDNLVTPKPYIDPYKEEVVERLNERILFRMAALGYDLDRIDHGPAGAPVVLHTKKTAYAGRGATTRPPGIPPCLLARK